MGWALYLPYRVGHLHFLPIAIMAISAYFTGIAAREWHWPFLFIVITGFILGLILNYLVALLIGDAPCFSVVIVGLTSIFIVKTVIENWDYIGGTVGFFNIPTPQLMIVWAYLALALMGFIIFKIENSQQARFASVVFHDNVLAEALGIDQKRIGIFLHSFSGMLAGLSGVLYAGLIGGLTPDFFAFNMIGSLMAILFVGGYRTMWGVVIAAPILGGIPILLPDFLVTWKQFIYGGLLIIIICFRPEGFITRKQIINFKKQIVK